MEIVMSWTFLAKSNPDTGLWSEQTFCSSPDVLARASKMPTKTFMSLLKTEESPDKHKTSGLRLRHLDEPAMMRNGIVKTLQKRHHNQDGTGHREKSIWDKFCRSSLEAFKLWHRTCTSSWVLASSQAERNRGCLPPANAQLVHGSDWLKGSS